MKLIFKGHDARYAVEQSLLAFFPQERPVYDPAAREENWAAVSLSCGSQYTTSVTQIYYNGSRGKPVLLSTLLRTSMKRSACASGR